jgi:hypothetical protein
MLMAGYYAVCECGSVDCPGGCGPEEPVDAELESLAETPEGMSMVPIVGSGDSRDATPEPPAYLDIHFILRNRARVQHYLATGEIIWPRAMA